MQFMANDVGVCIVKTAIKYKNTIMMHDNHHSKK